MRRGTQPRPGRVGPVSSRTSVLKMIRSKFTRGWEPLQCDARSAKSFKVLTLIFSTDCSPIDWLQSVLKITRFENVFLFYFFFENQASRSRGGEIGWVWCLGRSCWSESDFWQGELFCIANHSAASQLFVDRISAPCPWHTVAHVEPRNGLCGAIPDVLLY